MPKNGWKSKFSKSPSCKVRYYPYKHNCQVSAHSDHPMLRSLKLFAKIWPFSTILEILYISRDVAIHAEFATSAFFCTRSFLNSVKSSRTPIFQILRWFKTSKNLNFDLRPPSPLIWDKNRSNVGNVDFLQKNVVKNRKLWREASKNLAILRRIEWKFKIFGFSVCRENL